MLIDKRKYSKPRKYKLKLLKRYGYKDGEAQYKSFGYIQGIISEETKIEWKMSTYDELTFTISKYVTQNSRTKENKLWDCFKADYVIELSNTIDDTKQLFTIAAVTNNVQESVVTRTIQCYSLEHEFTKRQVKNLTSYGTTPSTSEVLYSRTIQDILTHVANKDVEGDYTYGILPRYMNNTWTLGEVDAIVAIKKRTYNFSSGTLWGFFTEIQDSFNCIFEFDTIKRKINVRDLSTYPTCPMCHQNEHLIYRQSSVTCKNPKCKELNGGNYWTTSVYGKDSGLFISDKNYITSLSEQQELNEIITKLNVYGANELSITLADDNIAGTSYIMDYSYFRDNGYFTHDLEKKYDEYFEMVETKAGVIKRLLQEQTDINNYISKLNIGILDISSTVKDLNSELKKILKYTDTNQKINALNSLNGDYEAALNNLTVNNGLNSLQELYNVLQARLDAYNALMTLLSNSSSSYNEIKNQKNSIKTQQDKITALIDNLKKELVNATGTSESIYTIDAKNYSGGILTGYTTNTTGNTLIAIQNELAKTRNNLSLPNYLGEDLYKELSSFGGETDYINNSISIDENVEFGSQDYYNTVNSLYYDGLSQLRRISYPPIDIKLDIVNFLQVVKRQHDWGKLNIGDMVHVRHPDSIQSEYILRVVSITDKGDGDDKIYIDLSNNDGFKSVAGKGSIKLKNIMRTTNAVANSKNSWDSSTAVNAVAQIMENGLNDVIKGLRTSGNQLITYNNLGITIESDLPEYKGKAIRITNSAIAFTENGWQTLQLAVTPKGIVADSLYGKIIAGMNLIIEATDEDGKTVTFKVDSKGVFLNNGYLFITNDNGYGITLDPATGLTNTNSDNTVRVRLGVNDGIKIQTQSKGGKWTNPTDVFYVTPNGKMRLDGELWARQIFVGPGKDEVLVDNDKGNTSVDGNYINAKGIQVKKGTTTTFEVDNSGNVKGNNCKFVNGTFSGDFVAGNISSETNINVETNAYVGKKLYVQAGAATPSDLDSDLNGGIIWYVNDNDGNKQSKAGMFMMGSGELAYCTFDNMILGDRGYVSVKGDLTDLERKITQWVSQNFQPKTII